MRNKLNLLVIVGLVLMLVSAVLACAPTTKVLITSSTQVVIDTISTTPVSTTATNSTTLSTTFVTTAATTQATSPAITVTLIPTTTTTIIPTIITTTVPTTTTTTTTPTTTTTTTTPTTTTTLTPVTTTTTNTATGTPIPSIIAVSVTGYTPGPRITVAFTVINDGGPGQISVKATIGSETQGQSIYVDGYVFGQREKRYYVTLDFPDLYSADGLLYEVSPGGLH